MTDPAAEHRNPTFAATVVTALWLGLLAGWIEVIGLTLLHERRPILELSRDYPWMTPLAIGAVTGALGLAMSLVLRRRANARWSAAIFLALLAAVLELLLYLPGLHHLAVLALAAGIALQLTRTLGPHRAAVDRLAARTTPWLAALVLLAAAGRAATTRLGERRRLSRLPAPPAGAPNVILVTLDAVRAANLSLYGYARPTTPALARFAARGAVFERAIAAASWTLPSHASIMTGRWHHELSVDYDRPLDRAAPTIAELLRSKGWATGAVVANLRYCGYETGLDRGFIHYHDYPVSLGQLASSSKLARTLLDNFRLRRLIGTDQHLVRKSADDVSAEALRWVASVGDRPFFLFLNYFDAHEPYLPPAGFERRFGPGRAHGRVSPLHRWLWDRAFGRAELAPVETREEMDAYDGSIAYLDRTLGGLLDTLDRQGRLARTVVIVTADHGEEFGEHRVYEHGYSLYRRSVEVPLVVVAPGLVPPGVRVPGPVSLRDLPATIADLAGLAGARFPGGSLAALWRADPPADEASPPILSQVDQVGGHPAWFPTSQGDVRAVTYRGLRYIRVGTAAGELFDFDRDPEERHDLAKNERYLTPLAGLRAIADTMVTSAGGRSP